MENLIHHPSTKATAPKALRQSLINSVEICEQKGWFQHHLKRPSTWSLGMEFGLAVHHGMEHYCHSLDVDAAADATRDKFIDDLWNCMRYGRAIKPISYKIRNHWSSLDSLALDATSAVRGMAKHLQENYLTDGWNIHFVEESFDLEFNGYPVSGTIDLVLKKGAEVLIIDYKTTSSKDVNRWANASVSAQPLLYTWAVMNMLKRKTTRQIKWMYLVHGYGVDFPANRDLSEHGPFTFTDEHINHLNHLLAHSHQVVNSSGSGLKGAIGHPLCSREWCDWHERCPHVNKATVEFIQGNIDQQYMKGEQHGIN